MSLIQRYLGRTLVQSTLLITVMFIAILFFVFLIMEVDQIGLGDYQVDDALQYAFAHGVSACYAIFPIICLLGALAGLGQLAAHHEIIVMRCAGYSIRRIVANVLPSATLIVLVAALVGELWLPRWVTSVNHHKAIAQSSGNIMQSSQGMWIKNGRNMVHVEQLVSPTELHNVQQFRFGKQHDLQSITSANTAKRVANGWLLQDVKRTRFHKDAVRADKFNYLRVSELLSSRLLALSVLTPDEMTLPMLYRYMRGQLDNHINVSGHALELWQRALKPLTALVMIILAMPFMMGSMRHLTMSTRMTIGIVGGFAFYWADHFFANFSLAFNTPVYLAALLPSVVFLSIGVIMLFRAEGRAGA